MEKQGNESATQQLKKGTDQPTHPAVFDVVPLSAPLTLADGREIRQITLRTAKVRDLKLAQRIGGDSVTQELALIGIICHEGLTPDDLEDMDLGDYQRVQASFRRMLDRSGLAAQGAGVAGAVVPHAA
ncbi:MAG: phage tail assembly protein [Burkholderia sp.]